MLAVQQAAEGLVMQRFEMQQMPVQQMPPRSPTTPPMAPVEQIMPLQQPVQRRLAHIARAAEDHDDLLAGLFLSERADTRVGRRSS